MNWPSADALLEGVQREIANLPRIRDVGLLDSALGSARNVEAYATDDPFEITGHLVVGIISNHPMVDGNKRLAWVAGCTLLEINGFPVGVLKSTGQALASELLKKVAAKRAGVPEVSAFLPGSIGSG